MTLSIYLNDMQMELRDQFKVYDTGEQTRLNLYLRKDRERLYFVVRLSVGKIRNLCLSL